MSIKFSSFLIFIISFVSILGIGMVTFVFMTDAGKTALIKRQHLIEQTHTTALIVSRKFLEITVNRLKIITENKEITEAIESSNAGMATAVMNHYYELDPEYIFDIYLLEKKSEGAWVDLSSRMRIGENDISRLLNTSYEYESWTVFRGEDEVYLIYNIPITSSDGGEDIATLRVGYTLSGINYILSEIVNATPAKCTSLSFPGKKPFAQSAGECTPYLKSLGEMNLLETRELNTDIVTLQIFSDIPSLSGLHIGIVLDNLQLTESVSRQFTKIVWVILILLFFTFWIYFFIRRKIGRDVRNLVEYTVNTDFTSTDACPQSTIVEFNTIAKSFHQMILMLNNENIVRKQAELRTKKLNEELEERVLKRTNELSLANEKLVEATKVAKEANRAKSEFLANMSHEIRTPMNAILGFTEIMKGKIVDPHLSHYLESIYSSGRSLLSLINDILDLSKVEAGKLNLEYMAFSPQQLFSEMKTFFAQKIEDKGLDFIIELPPDLPKGLLLDETRIRQILINLIGNAVKFTETGHIKLSINYRYVDQTKHNRLDFIFSVEDTGKGIPKEEYESIFKSFAQVKGQRTSQFGGTGLGLTITKRLINMMGGEITVRSKLGVGSTFHIILKGVEVSAIETVEAHKKKFVDLKSLQFEKSTIVLADDIEFNRELIAGFLGDYNFNVVEAENGQDALEKIRESRPQLILMDMKMPVMDGYEATRILNNDKEFKTIPIIAITASAMKKEEDIISSICDAYLRKPVSKAELITEIMKFLPHTLHKAESSNQPLPEEHQVEVPVIPPPVEKMDTLYDLAMRGLMDEIVEFANQLEQLDPKYRPFASKLRTLAAGFKDDQILKIVEEYMENDK